MREEIKILQQQNARTSANGIFRTFVQAACDGYYSAIVFGAAAKKIIIKKKKRPPKMYIYPSLISCNVPGMPFYNSAFGGGRVRPPTITRSSFFWGRVMSTAGETHEGGGPCHAPPPGVGRRRRVPEPRLSAGASPRPR